MEPDDQSNIPTKPVIIPGSGEPSLGVSDSIAAALFGAGRSQGSGGAWQPPAPEELQRDFPQYEIRGILGRGGMGAVYKGWQRSLDRLVAIKILPPGMDDSIGGFTERFKREAKAMAQLEHPGIVAVHDAGTTSGGLLYFIMQCVEGTDVQRLVSERGRLDPAEALRITSAVCDALGYAHAHGIIHRDIKPSNIMLDGHGAVKVADFGLAKSTAPETTMLTGSNVTMGTLEFMAPESLKGVANVDHRVDLYAVGVMLYQMLTGELPRGRFIPPSRAVPGLDKRLDAIVDKVLQPEPAARYSTAIEVKAALEPITRTLAKRTATTDSGTASRKKPLLIVTIAVALAVAGFVLLKNDRKATPTDHDGQTGAPTVSGRTWQKVVFSTADLAKPGVTVNAAGELAMKFGADIAGIRARDLALRGELRRVADPGKPASAKPMYVQMRYSELGCRHFAIYSNKLLVQVFRPPDTYLVLKDFSDPAGILPIDEWVPFQFATVGQYSFAAFHGHVFPPGKSPDPLEPGIIRFNGEGSFRNLEILLLDGLPEAEALKAAGLADGSQSSSATEPWQDMLRDPAKLLLNGSTERTAEGLRFTDKGYAWPGTGKGPQRDSAIRLKTTFDGLRPEVRARMSGAGMYVLTAKSPKTIILKRYEGEGRPLAVLGEYPLRDSLAPGQAYELELRAVGSSLTALFNGEVLGTVTDTTFSQGHFAVGVSNGGAAPVVVKTVEVLDLNAAVSPSPSPQVPGAASTFPPGKWTKAFTKFEDIPAVVRSQGHLTWRDGWIDGSAASTSPVVLIPGTKGQNQGIRLHGKIAPGVADPTGCAIRLRRSGVSKAGLAEYKLALRGLDATPRAAITYYDDKDRTGSDFTAIFPDVPPKLGDEFDMELVVIGDRLYGKFNGKALAVVTDARLNEGEMGFQTRHLARDIEVINLDGLSEAEALKAAGLEGK